VTAVENSEEMVALFDQRLKQQPDAIRSRVRLFNSDWYAESPEWKKDDNYQVVYSLGNTITLTADSERLIELFRIVSALLVSDGLFVFDYVDFSKQPQEENNLVWSEPIATDSPSKSFRRAFSQSYNPERNVRRVTLHIKWDVDGREIYETESYDTLPLDDQLVRDVCKKSRLVVESGAVLSDDPLTPSSMWIAKKAD